MNIVHDPIAVIDYSSVSSPESSDELSSVELSSAESSSAFDESSSDESLSAESSSDESSSAELLVESSSESSVSVDDVAVLDGLAAVDAVVAAAVVDVVVVEVLVVVEPLGVPIRLEPVVPDPGRMVIAGMKPDGFTVGVPAVTEGAAGERPVATPDGRCGTVPRLAVLFPVLGLRLELVEVGCDSSLSVVSSERSK